METKTEIVDGMIPYPRDYLARFEPQIGGKLFLIKQETSFCSFLYENIKRKYEWVKVYTFGGVGQNPAEVNLRIHSSCIFSERLHSTECDCLQQFQKAQEVMSHEAEQQGLPGLLIYLEQEGRGHGFYNKLLIYEKMGLIDPKNEIGIRPGSKHLTTLKMSTYQACDELGLKHDVRDYFSALTVLEYFNVTKVNLMDDNPLKKLALNRAGITVSLKKLDVRPHEGAIEYLNQKKEKFRSLEQKI